MCDAFFDFCDNLNWEGDRCTPPCDGLDDPDSDPRCRDPGAANK